MKVFISHTFAEDDQELAIKLQKILAEENIDGYLAEKKKEYDLLIRDKIRKEIENSDHMITIVTNKARESASVNQEIGYALREGIKPVIMLEENAKEGVLTHGIEPEEFTRENFEQHCKNVTSFILRKGNRIKLTDKEKEQLIESVYKPCYNQMMNVYTSLESIIESVPPDPWLGKIDSYWKLKTEDDMRELFEKYSDKRQMWENLLKEFDKKFDEQQLILGNILTKGFNETGLLHNEDHFQFGHNSTMQVKDWLRAFRYIIFDSEITNAKDLYEILSDYSLKTRNGHYQRLKGWWDENNGLYTNILKVIPELVIQFHCSVSKQQIIQQRKVLQESIEKLTLALEEKLK